jgi:hypothetical protein
MKWLPGSLFLFAAFCFFIVAALRDSGGAFVAIGCSLLVIGSVLFKRAQTTSGSRKP